MTVRVASLTGKDIAPALPALARLRIAVFRDWPYLYDGSLAYEEKYLAKLAAAEGAIVVAAYDGEDIVGCATAAPMTEVEAQFAEPFRQRGMDIARIFYCGESVLLPAFRGPRPGPRLLRPPRGAGAPAGAFRPRRLLRGGAPRGSSAAPQGLRAARCILGQARLRQGRRPPRPLHLEGHRPAGRDREADAVLGAGAVMARLRIAAAQYPPEALALPRRLPRQARALGLGGRRQWR